jgi:hypothetical protein
MSFSIESRRLFLRFIWLYPSIVVFSLISTLWIFLAIYVSWRKFKGEVNWLALIISADRFEDWGVLFALCTYMFTGTDTKAYSPVAS